MKQAPFEASIIYHLYNRGNNRENIFIRQENYAYFLSLVKKYLLPIADIYSYCLLPNHFHLVLRIKEEKNLPIVFRTKERKLHQPFSNLFNAYTKAINKQNNRNGSLFQEHLKRKVIENSRYFKQVILYVHLNPVKHQMVSSFETYIYSSYNSLISNNPTLLQREWVIQQFEDVHNFTLAHQQQEMKLNLIQEIIDEDE